MRNRAAWPGANCRQVVEFLSARGSDLSLDFEGAGRHCNRPHIAKRIQGLEFEGLGGHGFAVPVHAVRCIQDTVACARRARFDQFIVRRPKRS